MSGGLENFEQRVKSSPFIFLHGSVGSFQQALTVHIIGGAWNRSSHPIRCGVTFHDMMWNHNPVVLRIETPTGLNHYT